MSRPRLVLADDHRIVADGLRSLLEDDYELVEIVEDGQALVESARRLDPDVIVADIGMPLMNGLEAVRVLRSEGCRAKVVFLTMHNDATYAARALEAGASGFVLKRSAAKELLEALETTRAGGTYVSSDVAARLERASASQGIRSRSPLAELTPRQRQVLQLFAEGHTAKGVAERLHISSRTAENHKARIMKVLGVSSAAGLIRYALRHDPPSD